VRLGDTIQDNPAVKVFMGCHNNENKLFYTQKANGIFGLAGSGSDSLRSKPTILAEFLKDREHVNQNMFTMCLSQDGGRLLAGGYDSSYHINPDAPIDYFPLKADSKFYVVDLTKMAFKDKVVASGGFGRTIVDSGTTYSYFPTPVYRAFRDTIYNHCSSSGSKCGSRNGRECFNSIGTDLSNVDERFPVITLTIAGKENIWYPRSYMFQKGRGHVWCITFDDNGAVGGSVLGASYMIDHSVIFDLDAKKIGIMDANCPEYSKRPAGPSKDNIAGLPSVDGTPAKAVDEVKKESEVKTTSSAAAAVPAVVPATTTTAANNITTNSNNINSASTKTAANNNAENSNKNSNPPSPDLNDGKGAVIAAKKDEEKTLKYNTWLPGYYNEENSSSGWKGFQLAGVAILAIAMLTCTCVLVVKHFYRRDRDAYSQASYMKNPEDGIPVHQWLSNQNLNTQIGGINKPVVIDFNSAREIDARE